MPTVKLELTEAEARILVSALNRAVGYNNPDDLSLTDEALTEFKATQEEEDTLRRKLQEAEDTFQVQTEGHPTPIPWPPTYQDLLNYLAEIIEQQFPESSPWTASTESAEPCPP